MEVASAVRLINNLVFMPGWQFTAEDHTNRFEGTVKVRVDYPAHNSNRDQAPEYPQEIATYATFAMIVADCDDVEIYRRVVRAISEIQVHEIREFLRVEPTYWAPFHPHRIDGMKRWGTVQADLQFGVA